VVTNFTKGSVCGGRSGGGSSSRQVLLIVDEFSAIASGERVARLVEIVRSYGASLVLAPQAYEGMGGAEAGARILNAAHTILLHSVPEPEALIRAAGTRIEIEASVQHDQGPLARARIGTRGSVRGSV